MLQILKKIIGYGITPTLLFAIYKYNPEKFAVLKQEIILPLWLFLAIIACVVLIIHAFRLWVYRKNGDFKSGDFVKRAMSSNHYFIDSFGFFDINAIFIKDVRTDQILKVNASAIYHCVDE